jgi:ribosome-associated heat shock protein Hsp15
MSEEKSVRIDKYLWAVRIYKTRSSASEACRKGKILIGDVQVKPSRTISANEIITVKKPPVVFTYRVIEPLENRVSAKLAVNYAEDITAADEKLKLQIRPSDISGYRDRGTGRPTKRERRLIDRLKEGPTEE